jgi:DNA-binding MarR family transcriptional regulator
VKVEPGGATRQDFLASILRSQVRVLRAVKASAATQDLTLQQFGVLRFLFQRGDMPMNALGEELIVRPPVITGIVDRLEAKGFVKRQESLADRRKTDVILTDKGNKAYQKVREDYRVSLREALSRSLIPAEQETLARLLERFAREIPIHLGSEQ